MHRFASFVFSALSLAAVAAEPPPTTAAARSQTAVFDAATARGVPPTVSVWSNGEASLDLREDGDGVSGRVLRVRSGGKATAVTVSGEFPIEESELEFTYFLPSNAPVWSLSAGMRVKEDGGALAQMRLPPVFGEWHTERIPLSRMMRGDTWRAGTARTAASLEIGVLSENGPGQSFEMDLSGIRVATREGPRSPMAAPALLSGAGTFSRTFRIGGAPDKAWLMAFGRPGFRARVNGRDVGAGAWCNAGDWPCREGRSPVAAEFSLDSFLREGENTVEIEVADGPSLAATGFSPALPPRRIPSRTPRSPTFSTSTRCVRPGRGSRRRIGPTTRRCRNSDPRRRFSRRCRRKAGGERSAPLRAAGS